MIKHKKRVLFLLLCVAYLFTAKVGSSQILFIHANPLTVASDEYGRMAVWRNDIPQYYNINEKGSFLALNDAGIRVNSFGPDLDTYPLFEPISQSMLDSNTIETVFSPGSNTHVQIHQRITCYNEASYYRITWTLTNSGTTTYTDCRFMHGGDTDFGPGHTSRGNWEPTRGMVFMSSTNYETTGIMGMFGGPQSPADHYIEAAWWPNWTALLMGILPDTVNPTMDDSGYGLQWNRAALAPGESWIIDMYEKWTPPGAIQVFGPGEQTCQLNTIQTNHFVVANYQDVTDSINLHVESSEGWDTAVAGTTTIVLQAHATTSITTTVTVPAILPRGKTVHCSILHAQSQTLLSLTNDDRVATVFDIPYTPTAMPDQMCLLKGASINVLSDGNHSLLANDIDPESHGLSASTTPINGPLHGNVQVFSDGTFLYTHNDDDALSDSFEYVIYDQVLPLLISTGYVEISILTVEPNNGPKDGRNTVTITGGHLGNGGDINAVSLNGFTAPIIKQSATQVVARAGYATVAGTGDVVVTSISAGTKRLFDAYTYNPDGTILSVDPERGPYNGGNTVTITGTLLGNGGDITNVWLCGIPATIISQSTTQVTVTAGACLVPGAGVVYVASKSYGKTGLDTAYSYDAPEEADLSVSGTAVPYSAPIGSNISFFITVSNKGPATATEVTATNTLPFQLNYLGVSSEECIYTNQNIFWDIGTLPAHSFSTITIYADIPIANLRHITNVTQVAGKQGDPYGHDNICTQRLNVDCTLDYNILGSPTTAGTPYPYGYGHFRVPYETVITNQINEWDQISQNTRYKSCGYCGTHVTPGTNRECVFTLNEPVSLTWQWSAEYYQTVTATHGSVEGMTNGWACTNWIFDLYPIPDAGAVFTHWLLDGQLDGNALKKTITSDAPYVITAMFEISSWRIRSTGTCTRTQWEISATTWGTFEICNPADSGLIFTGTCLFAITPHEYMHLASPDGIAPDGRECIDITDEIQAALPLTGNQDNIMDPGECITLAPIEFLGKNLVWLDAYFLAEGSVKRGQEDADRDTLPDTWEDSCGLNKNNPTDAYSDQDGDGIIARDEYSADTHPYDPNSCLALDGMMDTSQLFMIRWQGGVQATQYLQEAVSITGPWQTIFTNLPPTDISNAYPRAKQTNLFYRIEAAR